MMFKKAWITKCCLCYFPLIRAEVQNLVIHIADLENSRNHFALGQLGTAQIFRSMIIGNIYKNTLLLFAVIYKFMHLYMFLSM